MRPRIKEAINLRTLRSYFAYDAKILFEHKNKDNHNLSLALKIPYAEKLKVTSATTFLSLQLA